MDVKNRKQKFNQQEDLLSCFIRSNNGVVMAERNTNSFSNYFTSPAREEGGWWMLWCLGYKKMCKDWIVGSERVAALPRVPIAAVFGRVRGGRCVWGARKSHHCFSSVSIHPSSVPGGSVESNKQFKLHLHNELVSRERETCAAK